MQLALYFDIDDDVSEEDVKELADSILSDFRYYDPEEEGVDLRAHVKRCSYRLYTDNE